MQKICLINPPWAIRKDNIWLHIKSSLPHLGILCLAAAVERNNLSVDIADFSALHLAEPAVDDAIRNMDYEFFGITATTPVAKSAYALSKIIRKHHPASKIIFGGVHVTALPDEPFILGDADFVARGDGEITLIRLLKGDPLESIQGLSYRDGSGVHHVKPDGLIPDLESLPFPAYHKVNLKNYTPAAGSYKRKPVINMNTSRGCPGKCTFCNSSNIPLRRKSAGKIFDEIKRLASEFGIKEISFYDDTFTVFPSTVSELCERLIREKVDLTWSCFARADCVNLKMLRLMKKAGCHQVMYGVESKNEEILRLVKKNVSLEKNEEAVRMSEKAGISTRCAFMLGNPGETVQTIDETIRYAIALHPDIAIFNITTPYPGTQMFDWAKQNNMLVTEDWDKYDLSEPMMALPTISRQELLAKYHEAYRAFYFRWKFVGKKLANISFWHPSTLFAGARAIYGFAKKKYSK